MKNKLSKSCSTSEKILLLKKIVCSELSDGAWIDKETAETLIQVRKLQLGIERTNGEFS